MRGTVFLGQPLLKFISEGVLSGIACAMWGRKRTERRSAGATQGVMWTLRMADSRRSRRLLLGRELFASVWSCPGLVAHRHLCNDKLIFRKFTVQFKRWRCQMKR